MNGTLGVVYLGQLELIPANPDNNAEYKELMTWADEIRKLKIRTNAESPEDVEAVEDSWAGGDNLEYDIDHAKEAGSDPVTDHQEVMVIVQTETHLREILANIISETRR